MTDTYKTTVASLGLITRTFPWSFLQREKMEKRDMWHLSDESASLAPELMSVDVFFPLRCPRAASDHGVRPT